MARKLVTWVAATLVIGAVAGYYFGTTIGFATGRSAANAQLTGIVNSVFPKPPAEIRQIAGTITGVAGATLTLEVNDPSDYLPHVDGTPQKKLTKYAQLTNATKIIQIDSTKVDANGNPQTTTLAPSDLKTGESVMVMSDQNIAAASTFDVTQIEMVKY